MKSRLAFAASALFAIGFTLLIVKARRNGTILRHHPNTHQWTAKTEPRVPLLEIKSVVPHGNIYEIKGLAEVGSTVMINGQPVPLLFENSSFKYFVGPLHDRVTIFTITVQNDEGGVNTKQVALSALNEN